MYDVETNIFLTFKSIFPKKEGGSAAFSQSLKMFCEIFTCDFLTWFMSWLLHSNPQCHQDMRDWSWMGSHNEMVSGDRLEVKSNNYNMAEGKWITAFIYHHYISIALLRKSADNHELLKLGHLDSQLPFFFFCRSFFCSFGCFSVLLLNLWCGYKAFIPLSSSSCFGWALAVFCFFFCNEFLLPIKKQLSSPRRVSIVTWWNSCK